jgi:hypothetical protein
MTERLTVKVLLVAYAAATRRHFVSAHDWERDPLRRRTYCGVLSTEDAKWRRRGLGRLEVGTAPLFCQRCLQLRPDAVVVDEPCSFASANRRKRRGKVTADTRSET